MKIVPNILLAYNADDFRQFRFVVSTARKSKRDEHQIYMYTKYKCIVYIMASNCNAMNNKQ